MTVARSTLRLAVVCPMANERDTALAFIQQVLDETRGLKDVRFLAVLDQVSQDGTFELLRARAVEEPRLEVVWAPASRCVVDAYVAGYRRALETGFEWILEIDAGFSHRPSDLAQFIDQLGPEVDCVFGSRVLAPGLVSETPFGRRFISRAGSVLSNLLLGTHLTDMTSGFELFHREALATVLAQDLRSRGHFLQTEIKFHCRGMRVREVPIHYRAASLSVNGRVLRDAFSQLLRLAVNRWTDRRPSGIEDRRAG
jgi:dolichol-phosphate mannosyltransferase